MLQLNCIKCEKLLQQDDNLYLTKCGYLIHNDCLKLWLDTSKICPKPGCEEKCTNANNYKVHLYVRHDDLEDLQKKLAKINLEVKGIDAGQLKLLENDAQKLVKRLNKLIKQTENNTSKLETEDSESSETPSTSKTPIKPKKTNRTSGTKANK